MLQVAVEELARRARRPGELLQTHAAEMLAIDVKLLERDAAGIELVGVQKVLEPLPHLVLGPVLRMDFMPLASEKPTGNCKTGGGPVSDPWFFPDIISDTRCTAGCQASAPLQSRTAVAGLGHEMGSGEEALRNPVPSSVVAGADRQPPCQFMSSLVQHLPLDTS